MGSSRNKINKRKHKRYLKTLSAPAKKKQITILSLDYDGCGDFLFEEALEKGFVFLVGSCLGILIMGGIFASAYKKDEWMKSEVGALSKYSVW